MWFLSFVYGEHGPAALEAARRWSRLSSSSTCHSDLLTFTQMELIRGLSQGIHMLHIRIQPLVDRAGPPEPQGGGIGVDNTAAAAQEGE